jgi:serine/threonine-protein kinase
MVDSLGHYRILDRIGVGTLGEVFRARDTRLGRTVAVKLPGPELQADRERVERLTHDARIATVLSHPNIAALYEIGDDAGRLFLVFEFVPGEPLTRLIAGRPINVRRAVDLATQVADALADAHALEQVHGGLTTDTVIVTPKGNAKILDFGFARWTSRPVGELTPQSDIRALGAVLFEMVTGRPPGAASRGTAVPPELDEVVSKALESRGDRGYEAAAACAGALRAVAVNLDTRAASADPPQVRPLRADRRPWGWMIAVAVAIVVAVLVAIWRLF